MPARDRRSEAGWVVKSTGIELTLNVLSDMAWRERNNLMVGRFARAMTRPEMSRPEKIEAIVDFMQREFYRIDQQHDPLEAEVIMGCGTLMGLAKLDADDASLLFAALAMSLGIRCRMVAARYGYSWTCWVACEESDGSDKWTTVDPLRQRPERDPDDTVTVLMPNEREE